MKHIINIKDVELEPRPAEFEPPQGTERFDARLGEVGRRVGARTLGYNITVIPPGKRAFPFHNHLVNEEMFFILEGEGTLRLGGEKHRVRKGDFICCPPGGPETAHQLINTGDEELRFLAVSTESSPEVCEYPDSGKFAISGCFENNDGQRVFRYAGREENSLDYWDGE